MKQSATDPLSGKIDVGILTTGLSSAGRQKRAELIAFVKEQLKTKGKTKTIPYQKLFTDIKDTSQVVSIFIILLLCVMQNIVDWHDISKFSPIYDIFLSLVESRILKTLYFF